MRKNYAYGQQPGDIKGADLQLGWLSAVRHLQAGRAARSYWHVHKEIQFLYCFKGEYVYEFPDRPQSVLTADSLIAIPAGVRHRHLQEIDPAGHRIELLVSPGGDDRRSPFSKQTAKQLLSAVTSRVCTAVQCQRALHPLFSELDALAASAASRPLSQTDLALARTVASLILLRYAAQIRDVPENITRAGKTEAMIVAEAVSWLQQRFAEKLSISQLVSYIGYSRSALFELFKRNTGLTPADFLGRYRIKRAREMLSEGDMPIAKIAKACGFASAQYFNAAFKMQTGVSPSVWRDQNRPAASS